MSPTGVGHRQQNSRRIAASTAPASVAPRTPACRRISRCLSQDQPVIQGEELHSHKRWGAEASRARPSASRTGLGMVAWYFFVNRLAVITAAVVGACSIAASLGFQRTGRGEGQP
jgi:hypothetical protein